MLDTITKIFSIATLAILYLMALFNIGYFYVVGFHFIGVTDITNIVYSFGLVFLFAVLFVFFGIFIRVLLGAIAQIWPKLPKKVQVACVLIMVCILLAVLVLLVRLDTKNLSMTTAGIGAGFAGILISLVLHREWKSKGKVDPFPVSLAAVLVSLTGVIAGIAIAEQQIASDANYEVLTKSGVLSGVKILRSSSNGFIVYQDNRILFVPSGEVRLISGPVGKRESTPRAGMFFIVSPVD
jgi:hypothetical protein